MLHPPKHAYQDIGVNARICHKHRSHLGEYKLLHHLGHRTQALHELNSLVNRHELAHLLSLRDIAVADVDGAALLLLGAEGLSKRQCMHTLNFVRLPRYRTFSPAVHR